jgi:hypothetical protein
MPHAQSFKIVLLPSVQERQINLDPEMARFLRDGACRRWEERGPHAPLFSYLPAMDSKIGLPASTVADDVARVCVKAAGARRSSKLDPHQCVELRCF